MPIIIEGISFDNLLKARSRFEAFRSNMRKEQHKAGAVKAFEYTYKLSWHTMEKIIKARGGIAHPINGARDLFRAAAYIHLISDPEKWFTFHDTALLTSECFEEQVLDKIVAQFDNFSAELSVFLQKLSIDTTIPSQQ